MDAMQIELSNFQPETVVPARLNMVKWNERFRSAAAAAPIAECGLRLVI
jgi:hypothetical protein